MLPPKNKATRLFVGLCAACGLLLGCYYWWVASRRQEVTAPDSTRVSVPDPLPPPPAPSPEVVSRTPPPADSTPSTVPEPRTTLRPPKRLLFRHTAVDSNYGKVAVVDFRDRRNLRFTDGLTCEVLHYAAGHGLCLTAKRGMFTTYAGQLFDSNFEPGPRIPLHGIPSRCRVAPNGTFAALTYFVTGHSYSSVDFSTQTLLVNATEGTVLADFEADFTVTKDGAVFKAQDFNFWGVTFTPDSRRFYCTLSSNQRHYLLTGEIAAKTAQVIYEGVECPSVSPDGRRIAYKKRSIENNRLRWQLQILDFATMKATPIAERRSVDDQIEWLDLDNILYAIPDTSPGGGASTDVWRAAADGKTPPELFQQKAYSPVVVR